MVWQDRDKGESGVQFPYRYRVMLVDDEEEVREGVREKVEWNRCGFELVAEASNGQEAWETAKTVAPDVVITDIRMPFMSGLELCQQISRSIAQKRNNATQLVAEEAKSYIQKHYSNPVLSLESVCTHLHLSVSHFSTLFKQETGCGFVNYLTQVRLTQAAWLLDNTDSPVGEIAQQVGYSEPAYFSYVFKKRYGVSPMKYRYMKEKSEDGEG